MKRIGIALLGGAAPLQPPRSRRQRFRPPRRHRPQYRRCMASPYPRAIAPALEDAPFDELRVVLGNPVAIDAFRRGIRPFPDGSTLVKLVWKRAPSAEFASATVPGAATTVHVMVKDSKSFATTGGWGFGRFIGGQPVDEARHQTRFACHDAKECDRDWVFTRYAE